MKQNSAWAKNKGKSFEQIHGDKANEVKQKIANAASQRTGWTHSSETILKMQQTWQNDYENRCNIIRQVNARPEVKEKQRQAQRKRIEENGNHLARGKESKLEKFVRETIEKMHYTVIRQKGTKKHTLGVIRYFDIFIPELNLIIEADGEYWHCRHDRLIIDKAKTEAAILEGYNFLRISDSQFSRKLSEQDSEILINLINLHPSVQLNISQKILTDREHKLLNS
jgi:hypothetical protein